MNNAPEFYLEIFLQSGDLYWSDRDTRIRTVLGSCIAISLWHPVLKIGGLSHCLLPEPRNQNQIPPGSPNAKGNNQLDGRYVKDAVEFFKHEVAKSMTKPSDFRVQLFGGSGFVEVKSEYLDIGKRNTEAAYRYLEAAGFRIESNDTGGRESRFLVYNLWDGEISVKRSTVPESKTARK